MRYSFAAYKTKLEITTQPVVLVEGPADVNALQRLLGETDPNLASSVLVDTPEMIDPPPGMGLSGNRQVIEGFCRVTKLPPEVRRRFVALTDREFRSFRRGSQWEDRRAGHHIRGRLVWTRGHSMENYYFDTDIWIQAMRSCLNARVTGPNVEARFRTAFRDLVREAATLSVATKGTGLNGLAEGALNPAAVDLVPVARLNEVAWAANMGVLRADSARIGSLTNAMAQARRAIGRAGPIDLRWLCHGHLGLRFLWAGYCACVCLEVGRNEGETAFASPSGPRENSLVYAWARSVSSGACADYPPVAAML